MRLLLVPHASTDWNVAGRYLGNTDEPLNAAGRRQAALLADRLRGERIEDVRASDLRRAQETAAIIGATLGAPVAAEPRLRELHFGAWEGLTHEEVRQTYPDALLAWETDVLRTAPPGGETLADLAVRVGAFIVDLAGKENSERTMLVVAHRGSLQVLLCLALGLPPEARWQFRLESASLSELDLYPEGAILSRLNDTYHLRETGHAG